MSNLPDFLLLLNGLFLVSTPPHETSIRPCQNFGSLRMENIFVRVWWLKCRSWLVRVFTCYILLTFRGCVILMSKQEATLTKISSPLHVMLTFFSCLNQFLFCSSFCSPTSSSTRTSNFWHLAIGIEFLQGGKIQMIRAQKQLLKLNHHIFIIFLYRFDQIVIIVFQSHWHLFTKLRFHRIFIILQSKSDSTFLSCIKYS